MNARKLTCLGKNVDEVSNGYPVYWGYGNSGGTEGGYFSVLSLRQQIVSLLKMGRFRFLYLGCPTLILQ